MSTRHKGVNKHDYAAMIKRNASYSPDSKRCHNGDEQRVSKGKGGGSKRGNTLGFADSDEERDNNSNVKRHEDHSDGAEEGEHEQNDDPSGMYNRTSKTQYEQDEGGEEEIEEDKMD